MDTYTPRGLRLAAQKLSGFNRNRWKLECVSGSTSGPSRTASWTLPEGSILDLHSFKVHCLAECTGGSDTNGWGRFPADSSSLISRVEVYAGGVAIQSSFPEYFSAARIIKLARSAGERDNSIARGLYHGAIVSADANEAANIVFPAPLGFFSECSTRYLDSNLVGTIQVRYTFADESVLVPKVHGTALAANNTVPAGATNISYTLSDLYATIDSISVDGYQDMLRLLLQSEGGIKLFYKNYLSQSLDGITSSSHTIRWSLETGSLDRVYVTHRDASYRSKGKAVKTFSQSTLGDLFCTNALYFRSYDKDTASGSKEGSSRFFFNLNSVQFPAYQAGIMDAFHNVVFGANKLCETSQGIMCTSLPDFHSGMYVNQLVLNMPGEPVSLMSGYDCRGIQTSLTFTVNGQDDTVIAGGAPISSFMLAEMTSTLVIAPGRAIAVSL